MIGSLGFGGKRGREERVNRNWDRRDVCCGCGSESLSMKRGEVWFGQRERKKTDNKHRLQRRYPVSLRPHKNRFLQIFLSFSSSHVIIYLHKN